MRHENLILPENSVAPMKQAKTDQAKKRSKKHSRLAVTSASLLLSHTQTHVNLFGSAVLLKLDRGSIVPHSPGPLFRTGLLTVEWHS